MGRRRLAAIVAVDVVGYSRLMGRDEAGTLEALAKRRVALVDPAIAAHGGRIVKTMGDGLLLEFASAVEAVRCAVAIQEGMERLNGDARADLRLVFRIGIHLGDIIAEGDDIFGDGVNVAARLESLARPGGVCISRSVHDEVIARLDFPFEDGGERALKNIARPVHVWHWPGSGSVAPEGQAPAAAATAAIPAAAAAAASGAAAAAAADPVPALALPDKPSIAVLPFANMSGDPDQEYFADGLAEDLITELSRFRELFVIARGSSFAFKGRALDVKEIGRLLGVHYVVEGSVRRTGGRVRVNAQLIDALAGQHVWAERYDRDLADVFAAQDALTEAIVGAVAPAVDSLERERARRKAPENMSAWELCQRGFWHVYRHTSDDVATAAGLFERAIAADAHLAGAHAGLAYALYVAALWGFRTDVAEVAARAERAAKAAVALDERDPFARVALGRTLMLRGATRESIAECEVAIALNANLASAHYGLGFALALAGRHEEALASVDRAIRLSPYDPLMHAFLTLRSGTLINLGRFDEAIVAARESQRRPNATMWAHLQEAAALANLGRLDEARAAVGRALDVRPEMSMRGVLALLPYLPGADVHRYIDGLRAAGLPE